MRGNIERQNLTLSNAATPFGCCDFFDRCTDEIMTLHYSGGLGLLDWMGFNVTDECYRTVEFISFVRPEQTAGECGTCHLGDPCHDPISTEYGECQLTVEDFGRYGARGPTRSVMQPKKYCQNDPRWRLDGTIVKDEREWDQRFATDVLLDCIRRDLIIGNAGTAGQFDGLQQWVAQGYECAMLDSTVINWNGNTLAGGAGITWNGQAVAATCDFIDVLIHAYRQIRYRIGWSPLLKAQRMRVGDIILMMPFSMTNCLLDAYTCWSVCAGAANNPVTLATYEARTFRDRLVADVPENLFGYGYIRVDGFPIPLLAHDWEMIAEDGDADIYMLTGSVGSNRIWDGEHLSAAEAAREFNTSGYFSTDGGRILGKIDTDNECYVTKLWMHPRLFCRAPWAQVRFHEVACDICGPIISADPCETCFYPETCFQNAVCP